MEKHIVKNFNPTGGKHCITNSLKQVFDYHGYRLSEEMLFGLGAGLNFLYINLKDAPMVNGRIKVFEFEEKLAQRLNIKIYCREPKAYGLAEQKAKVMINQDHPVLIYADMAYLPYLQMNKDSHFGAHAIVLFGYDDCKQQYYVSDRDTLLEPIQTPKGNMGSDYHLVSYADMEKARSSHYRPFPTKHKYLDIDFNGFTYPSEEVLIEAILETCKAMLEPATKMMGITGIKKFSQEIKKWHKFDKEKQIRSAITNYFQISKHGGTGGGIFRRMYGNFLKEAGNMYQRKDWLSIGEAYVELSVLWDTIADQLWDFSIEQDQSKLNKMSSLIDEAYYKEEKILQRLLKVTTGNVV